MLVILCWHKLQNTILFLLDFTRFQYFLDSLRLSRKYEIIFMQFGPIIDYYDFVLVFILSATFLYCVHPLHIMRFL